MNCRSTFPDDFTWGAATSSYQIEGSPLADGAGASDWHEFAHTQGRVWQDEHGDVACDHYRRSDEDVAIIRDLGIQAYRFSIAWPRILPLGTGAVNPQGLAFYDRLVDSLLEAGIQPHVTLYHWDMPAALAHQGGWLNPDSPKWLAEYSAAVVQRLGDRVESWCTINEPWVVANHGYVQGTHPPGHQHFGEFCTAVHHLLLAHQEATTACRAAGAKQVGLVVNLAPQHPASDATEDVAAAARSHAYLNRLFLDPVFLGKYPEEIKQMFSAERSDWLEEQLDPQQASVDFLGINYYSRNVVRSAAARPTLSKCTADPDRAQSAMGWDIVPEGLTEILVWIKDTYGDIPMVVAENGVALDDPPVIDSKLLDPDRTRFLQQHFEAAANAIKQGVDLRAYFVWSLLDNFEWAHGYSKRFGIIHVDPKTQDRTPKASAEFYRQWIAG